MIQYLVFPNGTTSASLQKDVIVNWSNVKYLKIDGVDLVLELNNGGNIRLSFTNFGSGLDVAAHVMQTIQDLVKSNPNGRVLKVKPDFYQQWGMIDIVYTAPSTGGGSSLPYTVLSQIISQTGTGAPTIDRELENTTGTTFTWSRIGAGIYRLTAAAPVFNFPFRAQVFLNIGNIQATGDPVFVSQSIQSDTLLELNTWDATTLNLADTGLQFAGLEVHIYPI
jgi:hypothetical protein